MSVRTHARCQHHRAGSASARWRAVLSARVIPGCVAETGAEIPLDVDSAHHSAETGAIGWDPGLDPARAVGIALAGSRSLDGSPPFESCPATPMGTCAGLTRTAGWYNVSSGMDWSISRGSVEQVRGGCAPASHALPTRTERAESPRWVPPMYKSAGRAAECGLTYYAACPSAPLCR
jgi:hypothetical protein